VNHRRKIFINISITSKKIKFENLLLAFQNASEAQPSCDANQKPPSFHPVSNDQ
jgi:hypothetical protein